MRATNGYIYFGVPQKEVFITGFGFPEEPRKVIDVVLYSLMLIPFFGALEYQFDDKP